MGNSLSVEKNYVVEIPEYSELTTDNWKEIYHSVIEDKLYDNFFVYGMQVSVNKFPQLEEFRHRDRMKDHFWILRTNGKKIKKYYPHIDGIPGDGSCGGFNWPLYNCNQSSTTIWIEPRQEKYHYVNETSIRLDDNVGYDEVFKYNMKDGQPVLFRSDLWHYAVNETNIKDWRVLIKWEIFGDSWEELINDIC